MNRKIVSMPFGLDRPVRASVVLGGALLVLVALILPLRAGAASGNVGSQVPDAGYLTLGFDGAGNSFRWYHAGAPVAVPLPAGTETQALTPAGGCQLTTGSNLAAVTTKVGVQIGQIGATSGSGNTVVGIGVKPRSGSGASGTPCGQVNLTESITIQLGSSLSGLLVDRAELDIDAKYSVTVNATLYRNGVSQGTQQLTTNTGGTDSGPDCGGCDNYAFVISGVPFDKIVLQAAPSTNNQSAFSLQGGIGTPASGGLRASLGTRQSVFHLVNATGVLECGVPSDDVTGNSITTNATLLDSATCQPVVYSLETAPHLVRFGKDVTSQPNAEFVLNVTWPAEDAVYPSQHTTQITYDGEHYHDMVWCLGVTYDSSGNVVTAVSPDPITEPWCIVKHDETLQAGDGDPVSQIVVHELLFGHGDPGLKR